ncbi:MAG: adenine-specific methyltransferase EcoRI family protein [Fimbriimonadaceae bacterium]|nr:adenine-specific methyltransferase EcoRI family protein [Fimbriimonadaceae bacterium]
MSTSSGNRTLSSAKAAKQDEFYTQLADIANELKHYKDHFKGKVVLCNCDDPFESNFFKYFAANFNTLGLKKLVTTSYAGSPIVGGQLPLMVMEGLKPYANPLAPMNGGERGQGVRGPRGAWDGAHLVEINEVPDLNKDGAIGLDDVRHLLEHDANTSRPLKQGGDFRSTECMEILKGADIVVTNPPFSLFREYVAQLVEHGKQFLIIGSRNATHYQDIFKLIKESKLWLGIGFNAGNAYFEIPKENVRDFASGVYDEKTGLVKFRNVCWFTNIDHEKRHQEMALHREYSKTPEAYPTYDNYDAIEVGRLAEIPKDYEGMMGVPDTFLDVFNPDSFQLIGIPFGNMGKELGVTKNYRGRTDIAITKNGKSRCPYSRIIIKRRPPGTLRQT